MIIVSIIRLIIAGPAIVFEMLAVCKWLNERSLAFVVDVLKENKRNTI
jgi:hypothetical protein